MKPVVVIAEELSGATEAELGPGVEVRHVDGIDRPALLAALPGAAALIVRSATRVDADALAAGAELRVVARAGVGLDNVDLDEATRRGVMVVNAPTSNVTSAAELAIALMLAAARRISPAHASLRAGRWERSRFSGTELADKTLGIVGLGRVGVLVANRMAAFGMRLLAHDPFVQAGKAAQLGVRMVPLEQLVAESDFVTVHLPKTPETSGIIGADLLSRAKPGQILVNAARGGIVDEAALFDVLVHGPLAAAGLDVYEQEPCTDSPLFALDNVVATPHLGASTGEAQERAGIAVARSVRLALEGELVPEAVNVQGGAVAEEVRAGVPLAGKLGRILAALAPDGLRDLAVEVRGEITEYDVRVLQLAALTGLFHDADADPVTFVNAPLLARERGIAVRLVSEEDSPDHRNLVTLRGTRAGGGIVTVSGTLIGIGRRERLVEVNGFEVDVEPTEHLAFLTYVDRPGVVGALGASIAKAGINIAGMQVARDTPGGTALVALSVDSAVPDHVLAVMAAEVAASMVCRVDLSAG